MSRLQPVFEFWRRATLPVRLFAAILPAFLLLAGFVVYCGTPRLTNLFATPLESEQIRQVDAQLADWNIPHSVSADNIDIDAANRNTILLRLSLAGLPRTHIANSGETLAKASALTPDSLLEAQSRTGLAGDIAIALRSIGGIADASVVIAPARQASFTDESASAASASVRLATRPGVTLTSDAVEGIRAFVSGAVPSLSREHVILLDDRGVALGTGGGAAARDEAETTRLALQSAFDTAFGQGASIVRVHAVYKQRAEQFRETQLLPVNGVPLITQNSDERYKSGAKQYSRRNVNEDRGSITRDRESSSDAGALDHLSVAVLVDQTRNIDLAKVRRLAVAAGGGEEVVGTVRVEAIRFAHAADGSSDGLWWLRAGALLLPGFGIVVVGVCAILASRKPLGHIVRIFVEREHVRRGMQATAGIPPRDVIGVLEGEPPHTAAAVISALPTVTAAAVLDLYPQEERGAIVARMHRPPSPFAPTWEQLRRAR